VPGVMKLRAVSNRRKRRGRAAENVRRSRRGRVANKARRLPLCERHAGRSSAGLAETETAFGLARSVTEVILRGANAG
jgi:hypothetical protein